MVQSTSRPFHQAVKWNYEKKEIQCNNNGWKWKDLWSVTIIKIWHLENKVREDGTNSENYTILLYFISFILNIALIYIHDNLSLVWLHKKKTKIFSFRWRFHFKRADVFQYWQMMTKIRWSFLTLLPTHWPSDLLYFFIFRRVGMFIDLNVKVLLISGAKKKLRSKNLNQSNFHSVM